MESVIYQWELSIKEFKWYFQLTFGVKIEFEWKFLALLQILEWSTLRFAMHYVNIVRCNIEGHW